MNIHDPDRPQIFYRPAFLGGQTPIHRLQVWPLEGDQVQLALMLPDQDERFHSFKEKTANLNDLQDLVRQFRDDPEGFILEHFGQEIRKRNDKPKEIETSNFGLKGRSLNDLLGVKA